MLFLAVELEVLACNRVSQNKIMIIVITVMLTNCTIAPGNYEL